MVKLHKRLVKKRYYSKSTYTYEVISLNIPKEFHELLQPFLERNLNVEVQLDRGVPTITLTPKPELTE